MVLLFLNLPYFDVFISGLNFFIPLCPIIVARAELMGTFADPTNGGRMGTET